MNTPPRACPNIRWVTALTVVLASLGLWGIIVLAVWGVWNLAGTGVARSIVHELAIAVGAGM